MLTNYYVDCFFKFNSFLGKSRHIYFRFVSFLFIIIKYCNNIIKYIINYLTNISSSSFQDMFLAAYRLKKKKIIEQFWKSSFLSLFSSCCQTRGLIIERKPYMLNLIFLNKKNY